MICPIITPEILAILSFLVVRGRNRSISGDLPKQYKWNFIADLCSIDLGHEFGKCCKLGNPGQIAFFAPFCAKMRQITPTVIKHEPVLV